MAKAGAVVREEADSRANNFVLFTIQAAKQGIWKSMNLGAFCYHRTTLSYFIPFGMMTFSTLILMMQ